LAGSAGSGVVFCDGDSAAGEEQASSFIGGSDGARYLFVDTEGLGSVFAAAGVAGSFAGNWEEMGSVLAAASGAGSSVGDWEGMGFVTEAAGGAGSSVGD
jgi:hypothetical protein